MTENVTFEVQVQQDGQWTIHENYQGHEKDAAIAEAKKQIGEVATIEAVKVVMEVFDPDTGVFNDSIVFKVAVAKDVKPKKKKAPTSLGGKRAPGAAAKVAKKAPARQKKPAGKASVSLGNVVGRLLLVVLFSVGLAAIASTAASMFFGGSTVFGVRLVGTAEVNLVVGTFIVTFLVAAAGLAFAVMRGVRLKKAKQSRLELWLTTWWMNAVQRAAERRNQRAAARRLAEATARARAAAKGPAPAPSPEPAPEDAPETPTEETEEPAAEEAEPAEADADGEVVLSPTAEKLKTYMMDFITGSIAGSQADLEEMDNFNKFGTSLYLAGACEILATTGKMDPVSHAKIQAECFQTLGFKKSHAESFAERYEEYLMADSRYMQMFQAGRNAINIYLTDEGAGPRLLENALGEWNKPKEKEAISGSVAVMFTDIAGSTAMTQELGDAGAQQVVRLHNRIVREALSANAGNEVKHTGDGIMASFAKTSNGIDASIEMQRETALHNKTHPETPLHLKIGLNAGEPIAEDNDLFGTVVQLSARIVDKASADQIFVSQLVQGICAGKDYQFVNLGGFSMKGFDDDVTLYEVRWNGGAEGDQAEAAQAVPAPGAPAPDAAAPETAPQPNPSAPTEPGTPAGGGGNADGGADEPAA